MSFKQVNLKVITGGGMSRSFAMACLISVIAISLQGNEARADSSALIQPFTTDYCTNFPNGTLSNPSLWARCCLMHDIKYWAGGSARERLEADTNLRSCVAATGHPDVGQAMFLGVRVGGSPSLNTPWRWGYGWTEMRGYRPLTADEQSQVFALAPKLSEP